MPLWVLKGKYFLLLALKLWDPLSNGLLFFCDQKQHCQVGVSSSDMLCPCSVCSTAHQMEAMRDGSQALPLVKRIEPRTCGEAWVGWGKSSISTFTCRGGPLSATLEEQDKAMATSAKQDIQPLVAPSTHQPKKGPNIYRLLDAKHRRKQNLL